MSTERNELADEMCGWVVSSGYYGQSLGSEVAQEIAEHLIATGYRKVAPTWAETLTNDGVYEYTISSDCDGSNIKHWRRTPGRTYEGKASVWESYEPEADQ